MKRRGRGDRRRLTAPQRWLRRFALAGLASGWLGVIGLAIPMVAHGATDALATYGVTASGWAVQPYVVNDTFINIPATDQSTPYVFVSIDGGPSAEARAAYFFPGTAANGALASQGVSYQVPDGVDARYPGAGSASNQVGAINDSVASQAAAGAQSAQASEAYAQATAQLASYQFAPPLSAIPTTPPGVPSLPVSPGVPLPTIPPLPTMPSLSGSATATATPTLSSGGSSTPTATATSGTVPTPTPTPNKTCIGSLCLAQPLSSSRAHGTTDAAPLPTPNVQLPDALEQALATQLRAAELANPGLLQLAGGHPVMIDPTLPLASADETGQAVAQASNDGVTTTVAVHATHVQLFQGLIAFASIDSTLVGVAPGTPGPGKGAITTTITGMTIAGIPVTVDKDGVHVTAPAGAGSGLPSIPQLPVSLQTLTDALNNALTSAGFTISLTQSSTMSDVQKWQGTGGGLDVSGSVAPGNGVPTTHIRFSLGVVTGSLYAVPATPSEDQGGGFFGGFFGSGCDYGCYDNSSSDSGGTSGSGTSTHHAGKGLASLPGSLSPGELLAMLFIVQGFSTAAVAATASNAEGAAKAVQMLSEEESV